MPVHETFSALDSDPDVRAVVLGGRGSSFCAGADLGWMRSTASYSQAENEADAQRLAGLFSVIQDCRKPVIARIHGAAIGGGTGLVASCDIPMATQKARFAFSEVRLGLAPAVISPFVIARIGVSAARELFVTGERIANVAWGNNGSVLYLTSDMYLCRIQTKTKGAGFK